MRTQVQSLALLYGLRIWHCCELRCRSQKRLGSLIAVAVVPLAWEPLYTTDVALKRGKKQNKQNPQKPQNQVSTAGKGKTGVWNQAHYFHSYWEDQVLHVERLWKPWSRVYKQEGFKSIGFYKSEEPWLWVWESNPDSLFSSGDGKSTITGVIIVMKWNLACKAQSTVPGTAVPHKCLLLLVC